MVATEKMPMMVEMRENVARGALVLDEKIPDWYECVGAAMLRGLFNMDEWSTCIAGTLEIFSREGVDPMGKDIVIQFNGVALTGYDEASQYGFVFPIEFIVGGGCMEEEWGMLEDFWREEINKRLVKKPHVKITRV